MLVYKVHVEEKLDLKCVCMFVCITSTWSDDIVLIYWIVYFLYTLRVASIWTRFIIQVLIPHADLRVGKHVLRHTYDKEPFHVTSRASTVYKCVIPTLEDSLILHNTNIFLINSFTNRQNPDDNSFLFQHAIYLYNLWHSIYIPIWSKSTFDRRQRVASVCKHG